MPNFGLQQGQRCVPSLVHSLKVQRGALLYSLSQAVRLTVISQNEAAVSSELIPPLDGKTHLWQRRQRVGPEAAVQRNRLPQPGLSRHGSTGQTQDHCGQKRDVREAKPPKPSFVPETIRKLPLCCLVPDGARVMVATPRCSSTPVKEAENQSACRYTGLKAFSVRDWTHARLQGCGRKGFTSHWGFLMEPRGGLKERWHRASAGSENETEWPSWNRWSLIHTEIDYTDDINMTEKQRIFRLTCDDVDPVRVDVRWSSAGLCAVVMLIFSDVKQSFFLSCGSS